MNTKLAALAARQDGVFTRRDALRCGYSDAQIRARVRAGEWIRIRRGAYVAAAPSGDLAPGPADPDRSTDPGRAGRDPAGRDIAHTRLAPAVLRTLGADVAASHYTAALLHGLPGYDLDLETVHVVRCDRGQWRRVETAAVNSFVSGVVTVDAGVRDGLTTKEELDRVRRELGRIVGATRAAAVVAFADGRSESVGESRLRVLMDQLGLPAPVPQYEVRDRDGTLVARVDFCFPAHRVVVE